MQVSTITMPKDKALAAYREYREHLKTDSVTHDVLKTPRYQRCPGVWGRIHFWLNSAQLQWGDEPLIGPVIWWMFGEWQRFAPEAYDGRKSTSDSHD